jgi:hypothetical protein
VSKIPESMIFSAQNVETSIRILQNELDAVKGSNPVCLWKISDALLMTLYLTLFIWCFMTLKDKNSEKNNGLLWYLGSTSILNFCRFLGFGLVLYAESSSGCGRYQTLQWELTGYKYGFQYENNPDSNVTYNTTLYFILLCLSSSSSALFFTSYSYFAYSLSKVLDMLTTDSKSDENNKSVLQYSILLVCLNSGVWSSVTCLWAFRYLSLKHADVVDSLAQLSIVCASLTTMLMFAVHFHRAFSFLNRSDSSDGGRRAQLTRYVQIYDIFDL